VQLRWVIPVTDPKVTQIGSMRDGLPYKRVIGFRPRVAVAQAGLGDRREQPPVERAQVLVRGLGRAAVEEHGDARAVAVELPVGVEPRALQRGDDDGGGACRPRPPSGARLPRRRMCAVGRLASATLTSASSTVAKRTEPLWPRGVTDDSLRPPPSCATAVIRTEASHGRAIPAALRARTNNR
jgi:hypothetical protein